MSTKLTKEMLAEGQEIQAYTDCTCPSCGGKIKTPEMAFWVRSTGVFCLACHKAAAEGKEVQVAEVEEPPTEPKTVRQVRYLSKRIPNPALDKRCRHDWRKYDCFLEDHLYLLEVKPNEMIAQVLRESLTGEALTKALAQIKPIRTIRVTSFGKVMLAPGHPMDESHPAFETLWKALYYDKDRHFECEASRVPDAMLVDSIMVDAGLEYPDAMCVLRDLVEEGHLNPGLLRDVTKRMVEEE